MNAPEPVEFLYGIQSGRYDANDDWTDAHVVRFPVTKKTPKRIYYDAREWGTRAHIRFVDRRRIETDGEIRPASRHWWEADSCLHLTEPVISTADTPDLPTLKAAMAAAHPDRGGTHETFIAARQRYENARSAS